MAADAERVATKEKPFMSQPSHSRSTLLLTQIDAYIFLRRLFALPASWLLCRYKEYGYKAPRPWPFRSVPHTLCGMG